MDIQIIEHAADDSLHYFSERYIDAMMGVDAREFRIDTTTGDVAWVLRIAVLDLIIKTEAKRNAEYYENGAETVEEIYLDTGALSTVMENGTVLRIEKGAISIYLPVHDGFEDQETHWVAAVPVIRSMFEEAGIKRLH